jgi:CRISPR/Cas system Type II protein with McrA/HNH and RuvC-like nuclease domain
MVQLSELYQRYDGECQYCGCETEINVIDGVHEERSATLDHIVPRCRGGTKDDLNAILSCADCNRRKANLPVGVFLDLVARNASRAEWRQQWLIYNKEHQKNLEAEKVRKGRVQDYPERRLIRRTASPPKPKRSSYFDVLKRLTPAERAVVIQHLPESCFT